MVEGIEKSALPSGDGVDISAFAGVFNDTTASYKFLWTLALLQTLQDSGFNNNEISVRKMILAMLKIAEDPINRFKLRFGVYDKMAVHLENLKQAQGDSKDLAEKKESQVCRALSRLVPDLWLSPFFDRTEIAKATGITKGEKIRRMAEARFNGDNPPPYCFSGDGKSILVHEKWAAYFRKHSPIIRGWVFWHWAKFLQVRNPNVPAIISKIQPPLTRASLNSARGFWKPIIGKNAPIFCIYSGDELKADNFALDHYLPWTFVAHDDLWNLVPASKSANSSKSDRLPGKRYFDSFVQIQHSAIVAYEKIAAPKKWEKTMESHVAALKLDFQGLMRREELYGAYKRLIPPLAELAKANGFAANWKYDANMV